MKQFLLKYVWPLYVFLIFWPLAISLSLVVFIFTIFAALIFGEKITPNFGVIWSWIVIKLAFIKTELQGAENYDRKKSYVIIMNHSSYYDIFGMYKILTKTVRFVMKEELTKIPVFGLVVKRSGHIVIKRGNSRKALESIQTAKKKLVGGTSVIFFPEGTRTKTGKTGKFRRGAFQFALDVKRDILPISIIGSYHIFPPGTFIVKPGKLIFKVHPSISIDDYSKESLNDLTKKSQEIIENGLG